MRWKWRIVWLTALVLLWLLCSGLTGSAALALPRTALYELVSDALVSDVTFSTSLSSRLAQFPDWKTRPALKPIAQLDRGDLIYPDWFEGNWTVTTTLTDMVAPLSPAIVTPGFESNRQYLNQPIGFPVRFVEAQPRGFDSITSLVSLVFSPDEKPIVSDRAYNGMSLAKAYLGDRAIAVKVDPNNPNRQITLLKGETSDGLFGDRQLLSTVTARATEDPTPDRFITSEVFAQEFRGTPQLYFNEVENTTAYRHQPDNPTVPIVADQVTAIYLSPQDPDYFKTIPSGNFLGEPQPVALYRYRMEFQRKGQEKGRGR